MSVPAARSVDAREPHVLGHGDLIGRTPTAALVIDDPRVSEAHAIVSLRKGEMTLLSLRRLLVANGAPTSEVRLTAGARITIVDELELVVDRVVSPPNVLAVVMPSGEQQLLPQVASFTTSPPRLYPKFIADARAVVWSTGDQWSVRIDDVSRPIEPGESIEIDGLTFRFIPISLARASALSTEGAEPTVAPLHLIAFYDSIQILQRGHKVHVLGGVAARIVSELVTCGGPTRWDVIAREVWPDESEPLALRRRLDVTLGRLRQRLRQANLRDLVRADGSGQLALETYPGDVVEDRT